MNLLRKIKSPCNKCCVEIICCTVCPDRIEYFKRLKDLNKFCNNLLTFFIWANVLFLAVSWANNLEYPFSKYIFYSLYSIVALETLFVEFYLLKRAEKYNKRKFGFDEGDMLEEYKLLKENLPSISKEEMLTR